MSSESEIAKDLAKHPKVAMVYRQNVAAFKIGESTEAEKHKHLYDPRRDKVTMEMFGSPRIHETPKSARNKPRYVRCGQVGQSDISGMLKGGRRFEIEHKSKGDWPTIDQWVWLLSCHAAGGLVGVVWSSQDAWDVIDGKDDFEALARRKAPDHLVRAYL